MRTPSEAGKGKPADRGEQRTAGLGVAPGIGTQMNPGAAVSMHNLWGSLDLFPLTEFHIVQIIFVQYGSGCFACLCVLIKVLGIQFLHSKVPFQSGEMKSWCWKSSKRSGLVFGVSLLTWPGNLRIMTHCPLDVMECFCSNIDTSGLLWAEQGSESFVDFQDGIYLSPAHSGCHQADEKE